MKLHRRCSDQIFGWSFDDAYMVNFIRIRRSTKLEYTSSLLDDESLICCCWHVHDAWFLSWHKWMRIVGWIQGWLFIHMLIDADAFIWWLLIHVDLDGYELMLTDTMEQIIQCRCWCLSWSYLVVWSLYKCHVYSM